MGLSIIVATSLVEPKANPANRFNAAQGKDIFHP